MKVVPISGKARNGKDFTASIIKDIIEEQGKRVLILHFADYLKYLCKEVYKWNGKKDDEGRTILQKVGTDLARKNNPDIWVNVIAETILALKTEFDVVLIPDTRFPNEINNLYKFGLDVISMRINRLNFESTLSIEQQNHISETALDNYDFDYVINSETGKDILIQKILESGIIDKI